MLRRHQTLEQLARQLPNSAPPAHLRDRVLSALPDATPVRAPKASRRVFIAAGATALAGTLGVFAGPRLLSVGTASLAASEVRAALARVKMWHLTGWKLQNGKPVRWEVWGRRYPYFYREAIGQNVTFDDGKTRVKILAADPQNGRTRPVVLRMFSEPLTQTPNGVTAPNAKTVAITSPDSFLESPNYTGAFDVVGSTPEQITLRRDDGEAFGAIREKFTRSLTVDRAAKLPRTFIWHVDRTPNPNAPADAYVAPAKSYDSGYLEAEYDVALEKQMADVPAGALVYDLTTPQGSRTPVQNAATTRGLTVQATDITRDEKGNLRVVFGVWLGNECLESRPSGLSLQLLWTNPSHNAHLRDEQGRDYIEISSPPRVTYGDHPDKYFVPLEPLPAGSPPPRTLSLNLAANLVGYETNPETHYAETVTVLPASFALPLALPQQTQSLGYEKITADDCLAPHAHRWTLEEEAAEKRASYYHSNASDDEHAAGRARFWYQEAIRLAEISGNKQLIGMSRSNLESLAQMQERMAAQRSRQTTR